MVKPAFDQHLILQGALGAAVSFLCEINEKRQKGRNRTFTLVLPPTLPVSKRNIYNGLGWLLQWAKELLHGPGPELRTMRSRNPGLQEPNLSVSMGSPKIRAILFLS